MLAAICDRHPRGQLLCAQSGLLQVGAALSVWHCKRGTVSVVVSATFWGACCGAVDLLGGGIWAAAARCCAGISCAAQCTNGMQKRTPPYILPPLAGLSEPAACSACSLGHCYRCRVRSRRGAGRRQRQEVRWAVGRKALGYHQIVLCHAVPGMLFLQLQGGQGRGLNDACPRTLVRRLSVTALIAASARPALRSCSMALLVRWLLLCIGKLSENAPEVTTMALREQVRGSARLHYLWLQPCAFLDSTANPYDGGCLVL